MSATDDAAWTAPGPPSDVAGTAGAAGTHPSAASLPAAQPVVAPYGPAGATPIRTPNLSAVLAQVLLGVLVVLQLAAELPALLGRRDLVRRLAADPASVSLAEANDSDHQVALASYGYLFGVLVTAVVFIIWFYRARRVVDRLGTVPQHRSSGWAIGGWICPVINLWVPYQMTADILRGSVPTGPKAPGLGLVRVWWTVYLLNLVVGWYARYIGTDDLAALRKSTNVNLAGVAVTVVAAVLAILVVFRISASQRRAAAAPPTAGAPA